MSELIFVLVLIIATIGVFVVDIKYSFSIKINDFVINKFRTFGKFIFKIANEDDDESKKHDAFVSAEIFYKSMKLLTSIGVIIGLILLIFDEEVKNILTSNNPLNGIQVLGLLFFLAGLSFYSFYFSRVMFEKNNIPAFTFWVLCTLILIVEIVGIVSLKRSIITKENSFLYSTIGLSTALSILIVVAAIINFIRFLLIKLNTFFKSPTERLSIILGFFGTLIVLIINIIKN